MKKSPSHAGMTSFTLAAVAASLCAALGVDARQAMAAQDTSRPPEVAGQSQESTQHKWVSDKPKPGATHVKPRSTQGKIKSTQGKIRATQGKHVSVQEKVESTQGKIDSTQHKW